MSIPDDEIYEDAKAEVRNLPCTAAAANAELRNLFDILAEAQHDHHDALVEMKGDIVPRKAQFKLLSGRTCLFRTTPGKA